MIRLGPALKCHHAKPAHYVTDEGSVKSALGGEHTESNHRLIYTPAWGFTAAVPGSRRVRSIEVPFMHGEIEITALNYKPVDGTAAHNSTDFTPEFLQRCHEFSQYKGDLSS